MPISSVTIADLRDPTRYRLLTTLDMRNPGEFFRENARGSRLVPVFLLTVLGWLGAVAGWSATRATHPGDFLVPLAWAALLVFGGLLPLHEGIHALTYRWLGARDVRFSLSANKLAVYTCANRFVVPVRQMFVLAALPFVLISAGLLGLLAGVPQHGLVWAWALGLHAFGCAGDCILLAFARKNRARALYNYDDVAAQESYFFEKV